jgi:multiple sugar transport system substrate-binding protein
MIKAFNAKYPNITVDHQMTSGASDDVKKSLMTSFAAGDTDPDVIECDIIWVSQFAAAGWLMDLTSDLEAKSSDYLGGPLKTCYYDNKAYAFPDYTDVGLLYYRKDLVSTPPTTWDELVQDCKDNIGKNGIENGFAFQMFQGEPTSCNMLEFIKQDGGTDLTDGKFAMANDKTKAALEYVEGLIKDGISPESVLNNKPDDSKALFESGNTLFMRNWTYAYASAQKDTSKVAGNVGVTQLPVGPDGTSSSGTLGGWNMAINANTDAPEASKVFVEFMTSFEAQKIEAMERSTLPTVSKVYDDAEVQAKLPFLADVKDAADNAAPRPQVKDYPTISTIFQEYFHKALTGDMDNDAAMTEMDTKLNEALAAMQ